MIRIIDDFLNSITMYRLVLYVLLLLSGVGIVFSFLDILPYNGFSLIVSFITIIAVCIITNIIFSKVTNAPTNIESPYITALILFLILLPPTKTSEFIFLFAAAFIAMASKYILAINKKHIFNPVAIALLIIGAAGSYSSIWWVASEPLTPLIIIGGFLVVRKIRRFTMFFTFFATSFTTIMFFGLSFGVNLPELTKQIIFSWPILFFGTIMLTEPLTTPPTQRKRIAYAIIAGVIISLQVQIGPIHPTPELALIIANIYSFLASPKQRFILSLKSRKNIAENIYEFVFNSNQKPKFVPGQYLEWTLPHHNSDDRGNRRYFTIASSPTENDLLLGVKINENDSSSFKKALLNIKIGTKLSATSLAGDFTLPRENDKKLAFIAGGIGITPFRSIVKYLIDNNLGRDIVLFYACSNVNEFAYKDIFEEGKKLGIKTIYIISHKENVPSEWSGEVGHLDERIIDKYLKDKKARTYYISGPNAMVDSYKKLLRELGIARNQIVTDYFPGF